MENHLRQLFNLPKCLIKPILVVAIFQSKNLASIHLASIDVGLYGSSANASKSTSLLLMPVVIGRKFKQASFFKSFKVTPISFAPSFAPRRQSVT